SRARCDLPRRKSPLCVKLKENMLGQKEGLGQAIAQIPQNLMCSGYTTSSCKGTNRSKTCTSIEGYLKMPGEAWSQHSDSAASMFPLAPGWEEDFQDLSPYCRERLQNMSSSKEEGIKTLKYVQDDELNTPEICIQKFDYPTQGNVSFRHDTSPTSLSEDGMWDIPSLNLTRQSSINTKTQNIVTSSEMVDNSKSDEKCSQTNKELENSHIKSDMGTFSDEIVPIVGYEEEIISNDESVSCDMETQSILIYDKETNCMQYIQSVNDVIIPDMEDTIMDVDTEANLEKIDSLVDKTILAQEDTTDLFEIIHEDSNVMIPIKTEMDNSLSSDLVSGYENQQLNNVAISNMFQQQPIGNSQVKMEKEVFQEKTKFVTRQKTAKTTTRNETVQLPVQNVEKSKNSLNLNLAAIFEPDLISTPVILESLLDEDSFGNLLKFVEPDLNKEPASATSTVDFSEVSTASCSEVNNIPAQNVMKAIQPVIIKKSANGELIVANKQAGKQIKIEDSKRSE
ncbi:hypothetical protein L9F63_006069, partial [Diploptera punctata]